MSCNTQPNCRTSFAVATALLSPFSFVFSLVVPQPSSAETSTGRRIYIPISVLQNFHSGGCQSSQGNLVQVPSRSSVRLSIGLPRWSPASEVPFSRRTSTSWCWWLGGWSGFYCRLCTLIPVVPETTLVSSRTLSFCSPLVTFSLSSFNTTLTPAIRNHCSCFNSIISRVSVSKSEFLIYASLHHRFQHLSIRL